MSSSSNDIETTSLYYDEQSRSGCSQFQDLPCDGESEVEEKKRERKKKDIWVVIQSLFGSRPCGQWWYYSDYTYSIFLKCTERYT